MTGVRIEDDDRCVGRNDDRRGDRWGERKCDVGNKTTQSTDALMITHKRTPTAYLGDQGVNLVSWFTVLASE